MASVLQRRPHAGEPPGSQVDIAVAQDRHDLGDPLADAFPDRHSLIEVVDETALRTLIRHPAIVVDGIWETRCRRVLAGRRNPGAFDGSGASSLAIQLCCGRGSVLSSCVVGVQCHVSSNAWICALFSSVAMSCLFEDDGEIAIRVERRVQLHQVYGFVLDVLA